MKVFIRSHKNRSSRLDCFRKILLAGLIAGSLACTTAGRRASRTATPLYTPDCLILQDGPLQDDFDVNAYKEVLSAVALNWRIESPAAIEKLSPSEKRFVLIVPMRAARSLSPQQVRSILRLVDSGAVLVSEGITPLAEQLGFKAGKTAAVRRLEEVAYPDVDILWQKEDPVTVLQPPDKAVVLNRKRGSGEPMVCLLSRGRGNCLLLAAELNPRAGEAYARFPYFLQELQRAGVAFPFRSERLSALFDYAYRVDKNPEVLATYWEETGIRFLHVNAWDFYDGDPESTAYLQKLIEACHRNGILVYAWLELPHVSFKFWKEHPKWREKTATGRDAHVDWRYAMNLLDPQCFQAVSGGLKTLFRRFEWDGANLSEVYFDTPEGKTSPEDFTPLNSLVRAEFRKQTGIDPVDFFKKGSPNHWSRNNAGWNKFVEYRVNLETGLNERLIRLLGGFRNASNSNLDVVVTYVDNIYDPGMREGVGADVSAMFGLLDKHDFTLVLEDPYTVWHLGPHRYAELARTYAKLTRHTGRLGVDINIVDRAIRTYPTQKQTGTEFVELFRHAGLHFNTVMVYSENTMLRQDASMVSFALASGARGEMKDYGIQTQASLPVVYCSGMKQADFEIDGKAWPCVRDGNVSVPAGTHFIATASNRSPRLPRLVKLNGSLVAAGYGNGPVIEFSYNSKSRAIAVFDTVPKSLQVDNGTAVPAANAWNMLPPGSHKVLAVF